MHPEKRQERQGVLSLEALLLIPVLLCILLAIIEFGLLISTQILLKSAAKQAADIAALGGSATDILDKIEDVLGTTRYGIITAPGTGTLQVDASITSTPILPGEPLDYVLFPDDPMNPYVPATTGQTVQICITVDAIQLVPNLLACCGFSIADIKLTQCCSATYLGP